MKAKMSHENVTATYENLAGVGKTFTLSLAGDKVEDLTKLVNRAMNCWDRPPEWLLEMSDMLNEMNIMPAEEFAKRKAIREKAIFMPAVQEAEVGRVEVQLHVGTGRVSSSGFVKSNLPKSDTFIPGDGEHPMW